MTSSFNHPHHHHSRHADQPATVQPQPAARLSHRLDANRLPTSGDGSELSPTVPLNRSGNPHPARARTLRARLSERDQAILRNLADFRLMTGRQLQQLHVDSSNPVTAARRIRAVLRRLTELGVVVRLTRRIGGIQAGSDGHVYGLSRLGQAVLALDDEQLKRGRVVWETKPAFQDHALAIVDVYVGLRQLEDSRELDLLTFQAEPTAWRWFSGPSGERLPVKPDAFVAVGVDELEQLAFIEVDCATESLPTIERKCRRYIAYWRSGVEQQAHGVFPRIWWLVPDERRGGRLQRLIDSFAIDVQGLFAVTLSADGPHALAGLPIPGDRP